VVLDGWGVAKETKGNAIAIAQTPNMDRFLSEYPSTLIACSGEAVGLPDEQMGNSEVGHLNLGAGRVVYQEYTRISKAIADGSFFENPVLLQAIENAKKKNGALHLMGLLSDGGVHSHNTHLYALLELAKHHDMKKVFVHAFLDGRDVPPQSALTYIEELEKRFQVLGPGEIASICGRYYAMDRDRRWERTKLAYDALVNGVGERAPTAKQAVGQSYARGVVDEFVKPTVTQSEVRSQDSGVNDLPLIRDGDSVVFFNFRADRARQLTRAFIDNDFSEFDRGPGFWVHFVCMTEYDATFDVPIAFPPTELTNVLSDVLAANGMKQLHIAETEKYAHVTFFFNGGVEEPEEGEMRRLIPSPRVATYDLKPEMSAYEVTTSVIEEIRKGIFDVVIMNYANADMVGHTGILDAAVKAIETVDDCMGRVVSSTREAGGECIITGDHGNAEKMIDFETGEPFTAHTNNPVPCYYISDSGVSLRSGGRLADIAPTMLDILQIPPPEEMTGRSLIVELDG
jgi:2,3-bisphosphoglycerate-independent phosphoglycerate mutase